MMCRLGVSWMGVLFWCVSRCAERVVDLQLRVWCRGGVCVCMPSSPKLLVHIHVCVCYAACMLSHALVGFVGDGPDAFRLAVCRR